MFEFLHDRFLLSRFQCKKKLTLKQSMDSKHLRAMNFFRWVIVVKLRHFIHCHLSNFYCFFCFCTVEKNVVVTLSLFLPWLLKRFSFSWVGVLNYHDLNIEWSKKKPWKILDRKICKRLAMISLLPTRLRED